SCSTLAVCSPVRPCAWWFELSSLNPFSYVYLLCSCHRPPQSVQRWDAGSVRIESARQTVGDLRVRFHVSPVNAYCGRTRKLQLACHGVICDCDLLNRSIDCRRAQRISESFKRSLVIRAACYVKNFNDHELRRPFLCIAENGTALHFVASPVLQFTVTFFEIEDQFTF